MKKIISITVTMLLSIIVLSAQDLKADFAKMQQAYLEAETFSSTMRMKVYEGESRSTTVMTKTAKLKRSGDQYWYKVDQQTMVMNQKYMLMINGDQKVIVYGKRGEEAFFNPATVQLPDLEEWMERYESIEFNGTKEGVKHYSIQVEEGAVSNIELYIDATTFLIKKMIYDYKVPAYKQNNTIEVVFTEFDLNPKFEKNQFSEKNYVQNLKGELKTTESYSNYRLVNQG